MESKTLDENQKAIALSKTKLEDFEALTNSADYKPLEEGKTFKSYYFDDKNGFRNVKAEAVINVNIKTLYAFIIDISQRGVFMDSVEESKYLRKLDENYNITYFRLKGTWPVSDRDFISVTYQNFAGETATYFGTSVVIEEFPENKKYVRGENIVSLIFLFYKINLSILHLN